MKQTNKFDLLESSIGFVFKNKDLLKEALTHRSYLNENPQWAYSNNERLEFLGDAVLELAVTEELFQKFPGYQEGQLTLLRAALVNYQFLAKAAEEFRLQDYLYLSRGEAKDSSRAREVILANGIEALIGAIYLDQGFETIKIFVEKFVLSKADEVLRSGDYKDAKSLFQEMMQEKKKVTPTYKVLDEFGPDHKKTFVVGVFVGTEKNAEGRGLSKQEAELDAARNALESIAR
ncbi:MAG: ribonuclease III [bacterium]|nr:ribonuclease III [bacterium]